MNRRLFTIFAILFFSGAAAQAQDSTPTPSPSPSPIVSPTPEVSPSPMPEGVQNVQPENLQGVPTIAPNYQQNDLTFARFGTRRR